MQPGTSAPPVVDVYSLFVSAHDDLVGLIAYSLYKQQKIDFLLQFEKDHGRKPTMGEVHMFCSTFRNPMQVSMLENRASELLSLMTGEILRGREKEISKIYEAQLDDRLSKGPGFWSGVWNGVVGNIAFTALLALALLVLSAADKGLGPTIASLLGYEPKAANAQSAMPPGQGKQ